MNAGNATAAAFLGGMGVVTTFVAVIFVVLLIVARWRIFVKAGEAGWKSLIPVYSDFIQWRIAWKKLTLFWVSLGLIIGSTFLVGALNSMGTSGGLAGVLGVITFACLIAAIVLNILCGFKLVRAFGKDTAWCVLYFFFPNIILLVLAFGSSRYIGARD